MGQGHTELSPQCPGWAQSAGSTTAGHGGTGHRARGHPLLSPDQKLSHGGEGRNNTGTQNQRKCEEDTNPQGHKPHPWPHVPHVPSRPSTARSFQPPVIILNLQTNPAIRAHSRSVCACNSARKGPRLQCWELCVPLSGQSSVHPSFPHRDGHSPVCSCSSIPNLQLEIYYQRCSRRIPCSGTVGTRGTRLCPEPAQPPAPPNRTDSFILLYFKASPEQGHHSSIPPSQHSHRWKSCGCRDEEGFDPWGCSDSSKFSPRLAATAPLPRESGICLVGAHQNHRIWEQALPRIL